ncbi:WD40-repeat containing protein [Gracilaria domingensis]|nr:WD40-repeat containing protein [Gracilaria domingensis]
MADCRRPSEAALATYTRVCNLLAVSTADHRLHPSLFQTLPSFFSLTRSSLSDSHAAALACALLVAYGASWPAVRLFLRHFVRICSLPALDTFHTACLDAPFRALTPYHVEFARAAAACSSTPCLWDFSHCTNLSADGAAALMAASFRLPLDLCVEIDFAACCNLNAIALRPWNPFFHSYPLSHPHSKLVGLRMDACPISSVHYHALALLKDLRWVSLRCTKFSNLWRTAEFLDALPSLVAALFAGSIYDLTTYDSMKNLCRSLSTSATDMHDAAERNSAMCTQHSLRPRQHHSHSRLYNCAYSSSKQPCPEPCHDALMPNAASAPVAATAATINTSLSPNPSVARRTVTEPIDMIDHSQHDAPRHLPNGWAPIAFVNPTPVALVPHYRVFLLSVTKKPLHMLDGVNIGPEELDKARQLARNHFEHHRTPSGVSNRKSTASLLRDRELGISHDSRLSRSSACTISEPRLRKRRRTASQGEPVMDLMAAVAAAGIPSGGGPSRLSVATGLTVALAATSSAPNERDASFIERMRRVQAAALSSRMTDGPSAPTEPWSGLLPTPRGAKDSAAWASTGYEGEQDYGFEDQFSRVLLTRPGAPRIEYLCQIGDRPRQFEFNPRIPGELVYGTEKGYLVVMDMESGVVKASCHLKGGLGDREPGAVISKTNSLRRLQFGRNANGAAAGAREVNQVYGLSWLNKQSDLFLAGSNAGAIHVFSVSWMRDRRRGGCVYTSEPFDHLTSIHTSADDARFAVSGVTRDVGLYDLATGRKVEVMKDCHHRGINVTKFAHHNPHVLITASFDHCVKKWDLRESRPGGGRRPVFTTRSRTENVMACFSPDDECLLVSAIDNEVRQYSASDGRLMTEFKIPRAGNDYNFTRSYYMNNRDYIVSGASAEEKVRVFNAHTGAFFAEVDMDNREFGVQNELYVQTLRANPFRKFTFSALLVLSEKNEMMANVDLNTR